MNILKKWLGVTVTQPLALDIGDDDELELVLVRLESNVKRAREIFERRLVEQTKQEEGRDDAR